MATWRVARSLDTLLAQLNKLAPKRSKVSDGSIGDAAHASRESDHNPYIKLAGVGIVRARDFTNDPKGGLDCNWLANALVASGDPRIRYIIWNRRIWTPGRGWAAYKGSNPHDKHLHLSVSEQPGWFDSTLPWRLAGAPASPITTLPVQEDPEMSAAELATLRADIGYARDQIRADLGSLRTSIEAVAGAVLFTRFTSSDGADRNLPDNLIEILRTVQAIAAKWDAKPLGPTVTADVDYGRIATTVADEADRRDRERLNQQP